MLAYQNAKMSKCQNPKMPHCQNVQMLIAKMSECSDVRIPNIKCQHSEFSHSRFQNSKSSIPKINISIKVNPINPCRIVLYILVIIMEKTGEKPVQTFYMISYSIDNDIFAF